MPESDLVKLVKEMEECEEKRDYQKAAKLAREVGLYTKMVENYLRAGNVEEARMDCEITHAYYEGLIKDLTVFEEDPLLREEKLEGYINRLRDNLYIA